MCLALAPAHSCNWRLCLTTLVQIGAPFLKVAAVNLNYSSAEEAIDGQIPKFKGSPDQPLAADEQMLQQLRTTRLVTPSVDATAAAGFAGPDLVQKSLSKDAW